MIRIKSLEIENLDEIFDKIQKVIIKEKKVRISSIRLFRKEAIELINKHCEDLEDISTYEFLERSNGIDTKNYQSRFSLDIS